MVTTLDSLSHDALVLPPDQRMTLAYRLLTSIDAEAEAGSQVAWETEITQRIEAFDAGQSTAVSASSVFASLKEIAPD